MPDEPQRPTERLLRAWAGKRRAEHRATELHPATRRMLHDEVSRTCPEATAPGRRRRSWLGLPWPKLALGGCALAAMLVLLLVLRPDSDRRNPTRIAALEKPAPNSLADRESAVAGETPMTRLSDERAVRLDLAVTNGTVVASGVGRMLENERVAGTGLQITSRAAVALSESEGAAARPSATGNLQTAAPTPAPSNAFSAVHPVPMFSRDVQVEALGVKEKSADDLAAMKLELAKSPDAKLGGEMKLQYFVDQSAAAPAAQSVLQGPKPVERIPQLVTTGNALSPSDATAPSPPVNSQRFVQVDNRARFRANLNSPQPAAVLQSFTVEQTGQQVRVTDADGSVYLGVIVSGDQLDRDAAASRSVTLNGAFTPERLQRKGRLEERLVRQPQEAGAQNWSFRVQGTNRTLGQRVDFEANLVLPASPAESQARGLQTRQAPMQAIGGGQIIGRAQIGREQVEIRANAAPQ